MDFESFKINFQKKPVEEIPNKVCNSPVVSVCVQTYQHAAYIKECLDGILMQQTNFSFEILLGEDESTDGTRQICIEYAEKYPDKIRLFFHQRTNNIQINGAPTGRFNFLYNLYSARGEFIALCEGDDYWIDPLKLQKQVNFFKKNPEYVLSFHPCHFLRESRDPGKRKYRIQNIDNISYKYTVENLLTKWDIPTASLVFRNKLVKYPWWFTTVASGDIPLVMILFPLGKLHLTKEHMSVYRITGKGVSQTHKGYRMIHYRAVLYSHLNEYFNFKYENEIYKSLAFLYQQFAEPIKYRRKISCIKKIFRFLSQVGKEKMKFKK